MKKIIFIFILLLCCGPAIAKHKNPEKYYQDVWCKANGGIAEYELKDGTRIDCLTPQYAIEFEFSKKWAESIGQSLYYSSMTGKLPMVALIVKSPMDYRYIGRIRKASNGRIKVIKIAE